MEQVISAVGLKNISYDMRPEDLSGGYKRRLALAVQLVRLPKVIVMDEPLAGLDWEARNGVVQVYSPTIWCLSIVMVIHTPGLNVSTPCFWQVVAETEARLYFGSGKP
mmetsp:Transcript_17870/g.50009  ORF Transcript_17870/g.50009 Transcript_17870/m.50009 type:complete len:108 (+) Transcript_17870:1344-1667(+)